jgi:hypothetical protein
VTASAGGRTDSHGVTTGIPSGYDGTYQTQPGASPTVTLEVLFGVLRRFVGAAEPRPGCSVSIDLRLDLPITASGTFNTFPSSPDVRPQLFGTFSDAHPVVNGYIGTVPTTNPACTAGTLATSVSVGAFTAHRE